jgi:hypothetical protein
MPLCSLSVCAPENLGSLIEAVSFVVLHLHTSGIQPALKNGKRDRGCGSVTSILHAGLAERCRTLFCFLLHEWGIVLYSAVRRRHLESYCTLYVV